MIRLEEFGKGGRGVVDDVAGDGGDVPFLEELELIWLLGSEEDGNGGVASLGVVGEGFDDFEAEFAEA